jgi:hypothetical protein
VAWDVACDNLGKDVSAVVGHGQAERSALFINLGWLSMVGRSSAGAKVEPSQTWNRQCSANVQTKSFPCLYTLFVSSMLLVAFPLQSSSILELASATCSSDRSHHIEQPNLYERV